MQSLPAFDCGALFAALDAQRQDRGLTWTVLTEELWDQSAELNDRGEHALCPGAMVRWPSRGTISCQYALFVLRWLKRGPEEFLTGAVVDVGDVRLPDAGPGHRLRWDLPQVHADLNAQRTDRDLTWSALAELIGCTPSRLTNLRTARLADMDLAMRVTQWLGKPAATYVHAATW